MSVNGQPPSMSTTTTSVGAGAGSPLAGQQHDQRPRVPGPPSAIDHCSCMALHRACPVQPPVTRWRHQRRRKSFIGCRRMPDSDRCFALVARRQQARTPAPSPWPARGSAIATRTARGAGDVCQPAPHSRPPAPNAPLLPCRPYRAAGATAAHAGADRQVAGAPEPNVCAIRPRHDDDRRPYTLLASRRASKR